MTRYLKQAGPLAGVLALVTGLTLVAPPAFAAEAQASVPVAPNRPTLAAAAAAKVEAMPAAALAQATQVAPAPITTSDKPFFKSGKGAIALALITAGVGYAGYSAFNDRDPVKSPIR